MGLQRAQDRQTKPCCRTEIQSNQGTSKSGRVMGQMVAWGPTGPLRFRDGGLGRLLEEMTFVLNLDC